MAQVSFLETGQLAELLSKAKARGHTFVRVQTKNLLALGADPLHPTHVIDFTREIIRAIDEPDISREKQPASKLPKKRTSRRSGQYLIEIKGKTIECASLKELLSEGLKALERHRRGTLAKLSQIKPRSKRIVARNADELFKNPELAQKYAEQLVDGWWFGTNNSANETNSWLRRGADIAGLKWGQDISTSL